MQGPTLTLRNTPATGSGNVSISPRSQAPQPADRCIAGYRVAAEAGAGAGCMVYKVFHTGTKSYYALKRVLVTGADDRKFIEQLEAEHTASRFVQHPHLRRCHELILSRGLFRVSEACLLLEWVEGEPLKLDRLADLSSALAIFLCVAQALQAFEQAGYVHADVKPKNILLTREGGVRLIDLGQACPAGTVKERIQGTPAYIAPEQVLRRAITAQTDMYNFGATLYWFLTERNVPTLVVDPRSDGERFVRERKFFAPEHYRPDLPRPLSDLIHHLLRSHPEDRPADWGSVIQPLRAIYAQCLRDEEAHSRMVETRGVEAEEEIIEAKLAA